MMKAVLLAGGMGTRLREETEYKPKPMVYIAGRPIIWHIMKNLSQQGINEFIICLGYKGEMIRDYFINYDFMNEDIEVDLGKSKINFPTRSKSNENWRVNLIDTGDLSLTAERLLKIEPFVRNETFLCTYGDGLADINLEKLVETHKKSKKIATLTAVRPISRFGALELAEDDTVSSFAEKPLHEGWINGGFFILNPEVFNYLSPGHMFEGKPLEKLAHDKQLGAYRHSGFWQPMDTYRESQLLNTLWGDNDAPWKNW